MKVLVALCLALALTVVTADQEQLRDNRVASNQEDEYYKLVRPRVLNPLEDPKKGKALADIAAVLAATPEAAEKDAKSGVEFGKMNPARFDKELIEGVKDCSKFGFKEKKGTKCRELNKAVKDAAKDEARDKAKKAEKKAEKKAAKKEAAKNKAKAKRKSKNKAAKNKKKKNKKKNKKDKKKNKKKDKAKDQDSLVEEFDYLSGDATDDTFLTMDMMNADQDALSMLQEDGDAFLQADSDAFLQISGGNDADAFLQADGDAFVQMGEDQDALVQMAQNTLMHDANADDDALHAAATFLEKDGKHAPNKQLTSDPSDEELDQASQIVETNPHEEHSHKTEQIQGDQDAFVLESTDEE